MTLQRISEDRIRSEISKIIRLSENLDDRGNTVSVLSLVDPIHGDTIMSVQQPSLKARREYLESVLFHIVQNILSCEKCNSTSCIGRDEEICCVVQVTES